MGLESVRDILVRDIPEMLLDCNYNWFEVMEHVGSQDEDMLSLSRSLYDIVSNVLDEEKLSSHIMHSVLLAYEQNHITRTLNGEIVSESESDDPDAYLGIRDAASPEGKALIVKKRKAIRRRAKRRQEKVIAEKRFLSSKVSKRVSRIVEDFPNIGKEIEEFVSQHSVGADAWRRTGVLTFDGKNTRLKTKVTYEKIRQHLQSTFKRKFSYGTVIQLCVPRNKRRRSAKRHLGVANVTSLRARKGSSILMSTGVLHSIKV